MTDLSFNASSTEGMLKNFGFRTVSEVLEMHSVATFDSCWIHHAQVPVAVLAGALTNPDAVQRRFPSYQLMHLVTKRWSMDEQDAVALATVVGAAVSPPFYAKGRPYAALLREVIDRYRLENFFEWAPGHEDHYAVRPRGYGESDGEAFIPVLKQWRRCYRKLDEPTQMFLATIIWLYSGGDRAIWLKGLPRTWHAVKAIQALRSKEMLVDWARLLAMYPGW